MFEVTEVRVAKYRSEQVVAGKDIGRCFVVLKGYQQGCILRDVDQWPSFGLLILIEVAKVKNRSNNHRKEQNRCEDDGRFHD